jgi:hypothetical protein
MIRRWLPQDAVFAPSELEGLNQTLKIVTVRFAYISWALGGPLYRKMAAS